MLSVNCLSGRHKLSELPKYCQLSELTFLTTIGEEKSSFQSYLKHERSYASCQLLHVLTLAFSATKILPTATVDIPVNYQSWQPDHSELPKTWKIICFPSTIRVDNSSFQSYLNPGRCYVSRHFVEVNNHSFQSCQNPANGQSWHCFQLSGLTNVAYRAFFKKASQVSFLVLNFYSQYFAVTCALHRACWRHQAKTLQNLCFKIEIFCLVECFLLRNLRKFRKVHVISLELTNHST